MMKYLMQGDCQDQIPEGAIDMVLANPLYFDSDLITIELEQSYNDIAKERIEND